VEGARLATYGPYPGRVRVGRRDAAYPTDTLAPRSES